MKAFSYKKIKILFIPALLLVSFYSFGINKAEASFNFQYTYKGITTTIRVNTNGTKDRPDVKKAIKAALKAKGPVIIDFVIEKEENVFPMVPAGQPIDKMIHGLA